MTTPDLTMVFDPSAQWPDPEACPDWPLANDDLNRMMNPPRSAAEARERLRYFASALNANGQTRAPTEAERAEAKVRFFAPRPRADQGYWRWDVLGFSHLRPAGPSVAGQAQLIVEAAHVRGYLRKLDHRAGMVRRTREEAEESRLRRLVDAAPDLLARFEAELAEAEVGEQRHLQRLADERDAMRAGELRAQIAGVRSEAAQAAARLDRPAAA